jgi:beta-galactosidase
VRKRQSINDAWRFTRNDPPDSTVSLLYDLRPQGAGRGGSAPPVIKSWVLPTGNPFLKDASKRTSPPSGNLGTDVAYTRPEFDDRSWRTLDLPHDFAIEGPFTTQGGGGMGRLPSAGVVWYRKHLDIPAGDAGKSVFLDIDGAMSYSLVWCNGQFVGGWPYGYASFRLNLTSCIKPGQPNVLAIRLDNPPNSSRWYPGGGLYRNVWLVTASPVHVSQWGTTVTTPEISPLQARVNLAVTIDNDSNQDATVRISSEVFEIDVNDRRVGAARAKIAPVTLTVSSARSASVHTSGTLANPKFWGVGPTQKPNRYIAVTTVEQDGKVVDVYETPFGVRTLRFDAQQGFFLNGEQIRIKGINNHHDLGALGAALNYRALERQLEMLLEMGANGIRTAHNPPAPELLDLADKMGFVVMDEAFDVWELQKVPLDHHLFFADWHEQDLRSMIRRDRNHPSVILWSIGNEVGEQTAGTTGAEWARRLTAICHEEDPTRQTIAGMNSAGPASPMVAPIDAIGLNYQGAGLTNRGARDTPQFPLFHEAFPDKFILGSETVATVSTRGFYTFPVTQGWVPAGPNAGQQEGVLHVSSYDLYTASWSYAPDKEFAAQERYPYVAGEFVWTGWDYLGEPTPFNQARSSYFGIIDLAGFKKDRFYLYQATWRPDLPMAHILPHWNWPERIGQVTPVHVYTSGDEAELFLNGKSLGRKKKGPYEYRLRWDDVVYQPGELRVTAYKNGRRWAADSVETTGSTSKLRMTPDRATIAADGRDVSFITVTVADKDNRMVPRSMNDIRFEVIGPGEIVASDNGDPTDMRVFASHDRKAFNGLALVIVKAKPGQSGGFVVKATSPGLQAVQATITAR